MLPLPIQRPMPLWLGAWAPAAVRRAARYGDGWIIGPSMSLAELAPMVELYRAECETVGRTPKLILMRDGWVAPSRAEAEEVYGPEVVTAYKYYWRNGALAFKGMSEEDLSLENLARDRIVIGEPSDCVEQLYRWSDALGIDYVVLRLRHAHSGGPPHSKIMKSIELFGKSVIPEIRNT